MSETTVIGSALVHFVWQGAAIALLTATLLVALARGSARARYFVACLGLLAMAATPVLTVVSAWQRVDAVPTLATGAESATAVLLAPRTAAMLSGLPTAWSAQLAGFLPTVTLVWGLTVAMLSVRLLYGWLITERLRRSVAGGADKTLSVMRDALMPRLGVTKPIRIVSTSAIDVPTVIGWWRPAVLVPVSACLQLSPAQLEAVLAHELAHIHRHDYLVNALQNLVETVLFYHPAVWWLSGRIRDERELCCDDLAVSVCEDRIVYAHALVILEESRQEAPAFGLAATGGSLLTRVHRLLGTPRPSPRAPLALVLCVLSLVGSAFVGARSNAAPALHVVGAAMQSASGIDVRDTVLPREMLTPASRLQPNRGLSAAGVQTVDTNTAEQLEKRLLQARVSRDEAALARLLGVDLMYVDETGTTSDRAQLIGRWLSSRATSISLTSLTSRWTDATVAVYGTEVDTTADTSLTVVFNHLWTKTSAGEWRLVSGSRFRDPRVSANPRVQESLTVMGPSAGGTTAAPAFPLPQGAVRIGGDIREPRKIQDMRPNYPSAALAARVQGLVILEADVDTTGKVVQANVLRSIPLLDQAAVDAVLQWRYEPTLVNGVAVPIRMTVTVNFLAPPAAGDAGSLAAPATANAPAAPSGTRAPIKIRDVKPTYPPDALAAHVEGLVTLDVAIDTDGTVKDVTVVRSVPLLDQAAVDAVRRWQYTPAVVDGMRVSTRATVTITFTLPR